ncbi:hypothetical protein [Kosmotoga pacifica]|uniref:DUF4203 domain-containing protein n=1 Tax=Kosmotoga pacifica TaxID=1330330 RepID=A0A0G2ZBL2_9BACT|nr:hypothetical protein [Kosmotoga pacifica]AKI97461.1 hypothetical protein IX53_06100 [Kosmotoga pacifica]
MLSVFQEFADILEGLVSWLKSADIESLRSFIDSFESLSPGVMVVLALVGLLFAFLGRKIFIILYTAVWALAGYYIGFKWGDSMGSTLYGVELGLLIAVLLPMLAVKAKKIFLFIIAMIATMFLCVYLLSSLGIGSNLNILDPYFFAAGIIIALFIVRMESQLVIILTSLIGSFLLGLVVARYVPSTQLSGPVALILSLVVIFIISLFVQLKWYSKEKMESDIVEEIIKEIKKT